MSSFFRPLRRGIAVATLASWVCAGCGSDVSRVPNAPALPEAIASFDPYLAERIREAHRELFAEPARAELWMKLGMTYEANGLPSLAIECYRGGIEREESAKARSRLAQALKETGDIGRAVDAMQLSIQLDPTYAPSHWRLGSFLYDLGRFEEARAAYRRATEIDPGHTGGWSGLARLMLQENRAEEAIALLEGVLESKPDDADCRRLLRTAYVEAGRRPGEANASWVRQTSMGKDPWHREFRAFQEVPLMQRALSDLSSGRAEDAVKSLEPFAAENPDDLNAQSYLAWAYYLVGRRREAMEAIDAALARDANSIPVLRVLSQIHENAADHVATAEVLGRIVALDPNDMEALEARGRAQRAAGQHAEALETVNGLLELNQRHAAAWMMKGSSELDLGRAEDAVTSFRQGIELRPRDESLYLGLANALGSLGRWAEVEEALTGAPELSPAGRRALESFRSQAAAAQRVE